MASLLSKVQTLIAADVNRLLDRALEANQPALFQQHIRELQEVQEQINDQLVNVQVELEHLRQRLAEQQAVVAKQDAEVDQFLQAGLHEDALAAQERVNNSRLVAAQIAEQVAKLDAEYARIVGLKAQLDARLAALVQGEPQVHGLTGLARAKELTAQALRSLEALEGAGDPDVAATVTAIRTRLAEAEAQLAQLEQRALARGETPEALKRKELEAQLEARKARLGL
jgi:phage shock protein A